MCWQPISLKDPTSQELFEGVENERKIRSNQIRNPTIFHHPALGNIELPHLQDSELEERIIQHLAAAAAMGRTRHMARREGQRSRSGAQRPSQVMVFSTHPSTDSISSAPNGENELSPAVGLTTELESSGQVNSEAGSASRPVILNRRLSAGQSTPVSQDRAGPSDLQSFSDTLKSRLNAVSMRYKDSIAKNTRGWKERLFSRSPSVSDIGSEVRREVNAGIATVSRMMDRLDIRENRTTGNSTQETSGTHPNNERAANNANSAPNNDAPAPPTPTVIPS